METPEQREERITRLEAARARRAQTEPTGPTEIAPGRGDLDVTSQSVPTGPMFTMPMPWLGMGGARGLWSVDGRNISYAQIFSEQAWVAAAVMRMLTWAVRVPLKVYRRTGEDSRERLGPDEHPLAAAIQHPWEGGYPAALTQALLGPLLVHGNSVTEVMEGRSGVISFEPLDWQAMSPISVTRTSIGGWEVAPELGSSRGRTVSADSVVYAHWWSPLGPEGISPLQQLGTTVAIEDAATRYQKSMFRNGARPPSAITATTEFLGLPGETRDALMQQLREDITELYAGPDNSGRPALLPPGLAWLPVGHTAVEAELIDQRYIDREEVAAVYMIPPPMLGDLRRATFSNITELRQVAYTDGLGPPLVIVEQVMTAHILRTLLQEDDTYCEFDFAAVLRGDYLKEINALRGAISMGLLTPNEGRTKLNQPRSDVPTADSLWMPVNNLSPMDAPPPTNRAARRGAPPPGSAQVALPPGVDRDDGLARRANHDPEPEEVVT